MTSAGPLFQKPMDDFVAQSPENHIPELGDMQIYDAPLIGVAAVNDLLWSELPKPRVVGPHFMMPEQWLAGAKSVISYFLPFSERVRESNRAAGEPSHEWLVGRFEGEMFNLSVRRFLVTAVERAGGQAVSPGVDPRLAIMMAPQFTSNWSERHVAHIAGLGTFNLNRSFITSRGAAGRLGSVITTLELEPTPRSYKRHDDYCINCGYCIPRCPPRAISMEEGKDNFACSKFINEVKARHDPRYGCGKCQTNVPCEFLNPMHG